MTLSLHCPWAWQFVRRKKLGGSGDFSISALHRKQGNSIGIIGGVSAVSTLNFLDKLIRWSRESLPFIVCSDPELNNKLVLNERCAIVDDLTRKVSFLEKAGAGCIVMPCHISHAWHEDISKGSSLPFLHVGECVAQELKQANLKPLEAGSRLRIGVLGTHATLKAGFYQQKLETQGFEVVLLDKATTERTVIPAIDALNRKDMEGARNLFRIALQLLLVRAVNTVILACDDDACGLLPRDDPLLKKCIDPMDALARSTIKWANANCFSR